MAKEKVVGQSARKALRLTKIQKKLTADVKNLFKLYDVFKDNKPFIPLMKNFLKGISEEDFQYKGEAESSMKKLLIKFRNPKGDYFISKRHIIHFNDSQQSEFLYIMDLLRESIKERTVYHFSPVKWINKTETFIEDADHEIHPTDTSDEVTEGGFNVNRSIPQGLIIETLRKHQPQIQGYSLIGKRWKRVESSKKGVKIISVPHRVYEVRPRTEFGHRLLWTEFTIHHLEHPISDHDPLHDRGRNYYEVPSIKSYGMSYFLRIARSLLVDYHIELGNFERIKVCEYDQCNKLFVEERAGRARFCSKDCQRKFKQASPKYRCWNRQTAWIRRLGGEVGSRVRKLGSRYDDDTLTAYKPKRKSISIDHDCEGCATCPIGKKCPTLKKKNEKLLSVQQELPAIEKESSGRRIKRKDVIAKLKGLLIGTEDTNMLDS